MENKVFREKSLDRISSPEQLNDYVRVSNPGMWMALASIIVLLVGVCLWGFLGSMETVVSTVAIVKDGNAVCYVKENEKDAVKVGQTLRIGDKEYTLEAISATPVSVSGDFDAYALHVGGLTVGEWVYEATAPVELANGIYSAKIVTEQVRPISFLF